MNEKEIEELRGEVADAKIAMIEDAEAWKQTQLHVIDSTQYYYELKAKLDNEK